MFYTISYRHCFIHAKHWEGVDEYRVQYPGGYAKSTTHKTMRAAKLAVTRDWWLYCTNPQAWKKKHGEVTFNPNIRPCI